MEDLPDIDDCSDLNASQAEKYISDVMNCLNEPSIISNIDSVANLLDRISAANFDLCDHLNLIIKILIDKNLCAIFEKIFNDFSINTNEKIFKFLFTSLINFTDYSQDFCRVVFQSNLFKILFEICLNCEIDQLKQVDEKVIINNPVTKSLSVIHNIFRDFSDKNVDRIDKFKQKLVEFIKTNNDTKLGDLAMLTLSYIVNDKDNDLLDVGENVLRNILSKIQSMVRDNSKRSSGFTLLEMTRGLYYISANDRMKDKLHEYGGISILIDILQTGQDEQIIEQTLATIWQLSFLDKLKPILIEEYQIEKIIERFENHEREDIKRQYEGIMWQLKNKKKIIENERKSMKTDDKFDVFLSYSWENKATILQIRKLLAEFQIKVWIDVEQMSGSILESMARGIENSRAIAIAVSKSYMIKPNCRTEAEYAYTRQKRIIPLIMEFKFKPDGWLGILLGGKLYFEFSGLKRKISDEVVKLVDTIQEASPKRSVCRGDLETENCPSNNVKEIIKQWNCNQVAKLFEEFKLKNCKKHLCDLDGPLLLVMFELRSKSPEYFNQTLKNEFGMKFMDVLKFHNALNRLLEIS